MDISVRGKRSKKRRIAWRKRRAKRFGWVRSLFRLEYAFVVSIAFILSLFTSGIIPRFFIYSYEINEKLRTQIEIYQPKDVERQLYKINKLMRNLIE